MLMCVQVCVCAEAGKVYHVSCSVTVHLSLRMGFLSWPGLYRPELAAGKPQQLSCLQLPHGAVATGTPATAPGFLCGIQVQFLPFAQEEPMSHHSSPKARTALQLENLLSQKLASILTFYFSSCELESFCYISLFIMCVLVSVCPCVCTCFCTHATARVWRSQDNFWESIFSTYYVGPRGSNSGNKFWRQVPFPSESHLAGPLWMFYKRKLVM